MATEFKLPDLGENIASGDVVTVFVSAGDVVKPGQAILEVETDKAVIEVPCPQGGRVASVLVKKGDTVKVGQALVTLESAGAAAAPAASPKPAAAPAAAKQEAPPARPAAAPAPAAVPAPAVAAPVALRAQAVEREPERQPEPEPVSAGAAVEPAGPAVRRLARELGVDLARVRGSGPGGRIVREDVVAAVRQASAQGPAVRGRASESAATERDDWGPIRREQMSRMRKTIAANMLRSVSTIPHLTNFDDADVTELERLRKASASEHSKGNVKLTALSFVVKAVSLSLRQHPSINATIDPEKGEIVYKDYVNIGLAVDTPRGLVVPVLRDCDQLSIPQIAQAVAETAEKAKHAQYGIEDLRGGTFTISNLGAIGGTYSTPIINWPEVAILLVGRSRKMPVVHEDKIESRLLMPLSLSYDHRIVDGAMAARFMNEVIGYLESPGRLLLSM
jgi:pyruvate dehydrogenase E2 component (dihydrolipoamide acetyltransferase)